MSSAEAQERRASVQEAAGEVGCLFARHSRMVYGICRAMLRDLHEAEDATQQVFLSAHKALVGGAAVRDPGGWLATIARNECRGRIAAGMRRPLPVADEDLESIPDSGDEHARHAQREELRGALAELPERQREAVVLRYLYGLRYGEVATALGLSKPATEALLFRARRAMRTSLRPVSGAVIAVPVAVREQLALALPGFEERAAPVAVGAGVAGGLLAKLAAGGVGAKVATATVAVATVGAVGTVGPDRPTVSRADAAVEQPADAGRSERQSDGSGSGDDDRSGPGGDAGEPGDNDDRSGPGSGEESGDREDDERADDSRSGSSSSGGDDDAPAQELTPSSGPSDDRSGSSHDDADEVETSSSSGSSGSGKTGSENSGSGSADDEEVTTEGDSSGSGSSSEPEEPED